MKSKYLQAFSCKRVFLSIILTTFVTLMLTVGITGVSAYEVEKSIISENYNLTEKYSELLGEEIAAYTELDREEGDAISKSVASLINLYRKELLDLQAHPEASARPLTREIELAYSKGVVAGRIGWIYYYNLPSLLSGTASDSVSAVFEEIIEEIDRSTEATVIAAKSDPLCDRLNRAVYTELIRLLASDGDSVYSASVIAGAIDGLRHVSSPDLFGEKFAAHLSLAKNELKLQRCRDSLSAQMSDVRKLTKKENDAQSNEIAALLTYRLNNSASIPEMNEAMRNALRELIAIPEGQNRRYASALNEEIYSRIDSISQSASASELCGEFTVEFSNYSKDLLVASTKDTIANILINGEASDERLTALEELFNGPGGRVDSCASAEQLTCEILRSQYASSLHGELQKSLEKLNIILCDKVTEKHVSAFSEIWEGNVKRILELPAAQVSDSRLSDIVAEARALFSELLDQAKAERFLNDHKAIIKKSESELSASDELPLRAAIESYAILEEKVRDLLGSQIKSIAEKYKSVLRIRIRAIHTNDAFYLELCQPIFEALNSTPTDNIDVFYNNCEILITRSEAIGKLNSTYRSFTSAELYKSYSSESKQELSNLCKTAAKEISSTPGADPSALEKAILSVLKNTNLSFLKVDLTVSVTLASRGSENQDIKVIMAQADKDLSACQDENEMKQIASAAIFKINRILTVEQIISDSDSFEISVGSMRYLTEIEKQSFISRIKALKSAYVSDGAASQNVTVLSFVWNSFCEELKHTEQDVYTIELKRGIADLAASADELAKALGEEIKSIAHLSPNEIASSLEKLEALKKKFAADAQACKAPNELYELYEDLEEELRKVKAEADSKALAAYRLETEEKLNALRDCKQSYSAENYGAVIKIIDQSVASLKNCSSTEECDKLIDKAKKDIENINDLLDDAKQSALLALNEALKKYQSESAQYSQKALYEIGRLADSAKQSIEQYSGISEIPALNRLLSDSLLSMKEIKKDRIYSCDKAELIGQSGLKYPESHTTAEGYWGAIYSPSGIISDARFSAITVESDLAQAQRLIHRAAKRSEVSSNVKISADQLKLLKRCVVSEFIKIKLSESAQGVDKYTLQLLLTEETVGASPFGVVIIRNDNTIEFYNAEIEGFLMSVNLSNISDIFIVSENTINLVPLIVVLIILLIFELLVLALILFLRHYRKRKENNMLPDKCFSFLIPLSPFALSVKPTGGVALSITLALAALALGCAIAILLKAELGAIKQSKNSNEADEDALGEQKLLSERNHRPCLCAAQTAVREDKTACALAYADDEGDIEEITDDGDAPLEAFRPHGFALHRVEINLDVIEESFSSGELVTLSSLKKKRLISKRADYVKILARGSLTKPLVIEAHDFSRAAEEMLKAVGGEAIRIR